MKKTLVIIGGVVCLALVGWTMFDRLYSAEPSQYTECRKQGGVVYEASRGLQTHDSLITDDDLVTQALNDDVEGTLVGVCKKGGILLESYDKKTRLVDDIPHCCLK